jgi:nucleoside-diphosphate-sugar epimerase
VSLLITGGTGFLGPILADEYLNRVKEKVVLFDVAPTKIDFLEKYKEFVAIVKGDVTDLNNILDICKKHNVNKIAHLAAIADVDVAEKDPYKACRINIDGSYNIFEACRRLNMEKVVYISTGAVYGKTSGPVPEEAPYNPADLYGATKVAAEVIGLQYNRSYGIDVLIDRLYFIYGPHMFFEPISPFGMVRNAVEGKPTVFEKGADQLFEFTHVRDAANGVVLTLLADSKQLKHRVFNISSGKAYKLKDIAKILQKYIPNAVIKMGPGELGIKRGFPLDITRAKKELGYEPKISLEEGIKDTIEWLKQSFKRLETAHKQIR